MAVRKGSGTSGVGKRRRFSWPKGSFTSREGKEKRRLIRVVMMELAVWRMGVMRRFRLKSQRERGGLSC